MKKTIQFLVILISLNSFAQIKAYFLKTNGEVVKGFASISDTNSNTIKFRKNIEDTPKYFGHKDIDKIYFILADKSYIEYQYKRISKKNIQLMKVLIRGDLSLYSFTDTVIYNTHSSGKGFGNINIQKHQKSTRFYVSKNNDTTIIEFPTKPVFKSFKKNASIFFKDCFELVEKIRKKELKKSNIIEIVEFYNNTCSKTHSRN